MKAEKKTARQEVEMTEKPGDVIEVARENVPEMLRRVWMIQNKKLIGRSHAVAAEVQV